MPRSFAPVPSVPITPLKRLRFLSGYKQRDFARVLGLSPSGYNVRESGIVPLSKADAKKLARILGVPASELLATNGTGR